MTFALTFKSSDVPDFDWLADEVDRPEPLLRAFASYRRSQFSQTVAAGTDPYGQAYAPLSAMYAQYKSQRWGNRAILSRTGAMLRSYSIKISARQIVETVSADYAAYHQQGTSKMAKRALLPDDRGLPPKDQNKLIELTIQYVERQVKRMPRI